MAKLKIAVEKREKNTKGELGYYTSLGYIGDSPGVYVDEAIAYSTPAQALAEAKRKLDGSFKVGDTIIYGGQNYSDVDSAVAAIEKNDPPWH